MAEEDLISPQRKAEHLLYMADAVQRSIKSRRNIVSDMDRQRKAVVDDFEASAQLDTSEMSLSVAEDSQSTLEPEKRPKLSNKGKSEKKSKTKTIADLRQQLHDCKSALVEIQENASLKYLKLEMDYDELKESYTKLKELKSKSDTENASLKRKLSSAVGGDRVEWIAQLESSQAKLQAELDQMRTERDAAQKQTDELKNMCCATCVEKIQTTSTASKVAASVYRARSLWSLFQLDEEAKATTEAASTATVCGSGTNAMMAPQKLYLQPKTECPATNVSHCEAEPDYAVGELSAPPNSNDDLEADLEAIEQKMKDDIESMSREWKRPSQTRIQKKHTVRRDLVRNNKRNTLAKTKSSALDSFFSISQSIRNLGAEEMDEETSFYSLQRSTSASSSPEKDIDTKPQSESEHSVKSEKASATKTPSSASSSPGSQDNTERIFGQDVDAVEVKDESSNGGEGPKSVSSAPDRRGLMSTAFSIRGSLRSLSEEVDDESSSSKAFDKRLDNLRAKSLRGDFAQELGRKKTPPKSTLRSSSSLTDRKAVHWEDPSQKEDEAKLKVRKEVEAWAAVDLAPITTLSI